MSHQSPMNQQPQFHQPGAQSSSGAPPAKRQRLSPDARSPGPAYANGVQNGTARSPADYGSSHVQGQQQSYSPYSASPVQDYGQNSFNTPQSYQGRQAWQQQQQRTSSAMSPPGREMMPPPPRPNREDNNEKFGVDDVNDALFSSGINLKDEENYIHSTFANRHSGTESFSSNQNPSFGSSNGSFQLLTQATSFSSQPNGAGAGTLGAAVSQESVDDELKQLRLQAARKKAEAEQHHLRNPFLLGNVLRLRMERIAKSHGVRLDESGLYVLVPQAKTMMASDQSEGVVEAKSMAGSVIETAAPFVETLGLISLASAERARGLLDEAHAMARARRYADFGRVPIEFSDVAVGDGKQVQERLVPESITDTPWDQPTSDQLQDTVGFQSRVNTHFRSIAKSAEEAEQARIKRRTTRRKAAEAASNDDDATMINGDTADAPTASDSTANAPQTKMTKKEMVRQQKEKASLSEAQAATTTNQTAAMMALGKKGNRYSWMSGGAASMPTNRFAKPAGLGSPLSGSGTPIKHDGSRTPAKNADGSTAKASTVAWGEWREDNPAGRRIQARDWLLVLERDGREKRALERAQLHLGVPADANAAPVSAAATPSAPQTPAPPIQAQQAPPAASQSVVSAV